MRNEHGKTWLSRVVKGVVAAAAMSTFAFSPLIATAAPSQEDVDRARAEEQLAEKSVAQLEVQLASLRSTTATAVMNAQIAAEDLNAAKEKLDKAIALSEKTAKEAATAQTNFDEGRAQLASVAQDAYRSGSSSLDSLTPYLTADGLQTLGTRKNAVNSFGSAADEKLQHVAALEQVATIMKDSADKAKVAEEAAYAEVEKRAQAAKAAAEEAAAIQEQAEVNYQALLAELAAKRNTTIQLEAERQAEQERIRQEAEREAAMQRAKELEEQQAAPPEAPSTPNTPAPPATPSIPNTPNVPNTPNPPTNPSTPPPPLSGGVTGAIETAKSLLGAPYVWGGEGPGYDCSGLVTVAFRSVGIYLSHQTRSQWAETGKVSVNNAQAGDLIFWSSNGAQSGIYHVAIYLGGGQIIEAATYGVPLRITSIYNWGNVMPQAGRVR